MGVSYQLDGSHRVLESIGLSHIGKSGHCGDSVESSGHIEGAPLQLGSNSVISIRCNQKNNQTTKFDQMTQIWFGQIDVRSITAKTAQAH